MGSDHRCELRLEQGGYQAGQGGSSMKFFDEEGGG